MEWGLVLASQGIDTVINKSDQGWSLQVAWQDYERALISKGGGVFSRAVKSIPLSPEARALLGIAKSEAPPTEIVNAILYQSRTGCQWEYLPHDLPPRSATLH